MPRETNTELFLEIGGKSTRLGAQKYAEMLANVREKKLRESRRYRDITDNVMSSPCIPGDSTRNGPNARKNKAWRKGSKMPKSVDISKLTISDPINGQRGRKAVFPNYQEWKLEVGAIADVTDDMLAEILADDYDGTIAPEHLSNPENSDGTKYRKNRFSNMVTAARKANGEKAKFTLLPATDSDGNSRWLFRRDS